MPHTRCHKDISVRSGRHDLPVEQVDGGGNDPSHPGDEASLGVPYTQVLAYPTPHIYYSTGGISAYDTNTELPIKDDTLFAWTHVPHETKIPQTIHTSYSSDEEDIPVESARALSTLFLGLVARGPGASSSGDTGRCWGLQGQAGQGRHRESPTQS